MIGLSLIGESKTPEASASGGKSVNKENAQPGRAFEPQPSPRIARTSCVRARMRSLFALSES